MEMRVLLTSGSSVCFIGRQYISQTPKMDEFMESLDSGTTPNIVVPSFATAQAWEGDKVPTSYWVVSLTDHAPRLGIIPAECPNSFILNKVCFRENQRSPGTFFYILSVQKYLARPLCEEDTSDLLEWPDTPLCHRVWESELLTVFGDQGVEEWEWEGETEDVAEGPGAWGSQAGPGSGTWRRTEKEQQKIMKQSRKQEPL